jgi:hypothetical protein
MVSSEHLLWRNIATSSRRLTKDVARLVNHRSSMIGLSMAGQIYSSSFGRVRLFRGNSFRTADARRRLLSGLKLVRNVFGQAR